MVLCIVVETRCHGEPSVISATRSISRATDSGVQAIADRRREVGRPDALRPVSVAAGGPSALRAPLANATVSKTWRLREVEGRDRGVGQIRDRGGRIAQSQLGCHPPQLRAERPPLSRASQLRGCLAQAGSASASEQLRVRVVRGRDRTGSEQEQSSLSGRGATVAPATVTSIPGTECGCRGASRDRIGAGGSNKRTSRSLWESRSSRAASVRHV